MAHKQYHFWIVCHDRENGNKPYLVYGGLTEETARERAFTMLGGLDFDIKRYPTRDVGQASAFFRGKRLEQGEGLHASTERIGHQKSFERVRRRRSGTGAPSNSMWG